VGAQKRDAAHGLFIAYGVIQERRYFGVHLPPAHVAVLGHRHLGVPELGVPELIGTDPGGQAGVVDQGGHRLAEAVTGHVRHTEVIADLPPLLV
jgi:hypothetical protein